MGAALIGVVAGVIVVEVTFLLEQVIKVDDPVGAVAVHGANGAWGCLALGLFADGTYGDGWNGVAGTVRGLFYGGGWSQFGAQTIGVIVNIFWFGLASFALFWMIDKMTGMRSNPSHEIQGLDIPEMGAPAYSSVDVIMPSGKLSQQSPATHRKSKF